MTVGMVVAVKIDIVITSEIVMAFDANINENHSSNNKSSGNSEDSAGKCSLPMLWGPPVLSGVPGLTAS